MDEKEKNNLVEFKPKTAETEEYFDDEIIPIMSQEFDLPEDFIYSDENLNVVLTLIGIYKMIGLPNEIALDAAFEFTDQFGEYVGLVPPSEE